MAHSRVSVFRCLASTCMDLSERQDKALREINVLYISNTDNIIQARTPGAPYVSLWTCSKFLDMSQKNNISEERSAVSDALLVSAKTSEKHL